MIKFCIIFLTLVVYFFSTRTMSPVLVQSDIPSVTSGVFIPTIDNSCVTGSQLYFIDNDQVN